MSNKSYTLADSSTVTVNATANGVPFNEGMGALTKAIKAKITASSSGGASSDKLDVNFNINGFTKVRENVFAADLSGDTNTATVNFSMDSDAQDILTVSRNYVGGSSSVIPASYPDVYYTEPSTMNSYVTVNVRDKTIGYSVKGTAAIIRYEFYLYIPETANYKSCLISLRFNIDNE